MVRIAIVEDEESEIVGLKEGVKRFFAESGGEYEARVFRNGMEFLDACRGDFDVVLMDIEMPLLDGFRTAQKLRETDPAVSIIFVTNMSRYAIKGYEVDAVGFIVKPVGYFALKMNLRKAVARAQGRRSVNILAATRNGVNVIPSDTLVYVEVMRHNLVYHTETETITVRGSLKEAEEQLEGLNFARCNNCFLVNLKFVRSVENDTVVLLNSELPVSRGKKKEFVDALMKYVEQSGGGI